MKALTLVFWSFLVSVLLAISPAYAALDGPGSGLVGWWKFDEGSGGVATDSSGNGNNGILIGNPTWVSNGYIDGALSFNGITDYIRILRAESLRSGPKTIAVWVNVSDFIKRASGIYSWGYEGCMDTYYGPINMNGVQIVYYQNMVPEIIRSIGISPAWTYTLGKWDHYAIVYEGDTSLVRISLYKNGELLVSPPGLPPSQTYPYVGSDGLSPVCRMRNIGSQEDYPNPEYVRTFSGLMDDYRVYNRPLSADEVRELYTTTRVVMSDTTPPSAPSGLTATALSSSKISLAWTTSPSGDVAGTIIYRNGSPLTVVRSGTSYVDMAHSPASTFWITLTPGTAYSYTVAAYDAAGNVSPQTSAATATTLTTLPTDSVTLTVTMVGSDFWTYVNSIPGGLACRSGTCSASFTRGTNVYLLPYAYGAPNNPNIPIRFSGWSGDDCVGNGGCQLIMDSNKTVTAVYGDSLPPDETAPIMSVFSIPSAQASLTVPITALSATDARGVTGYYVTESIAPPSASTPGWAYPAPTSYAFSTPGIKTLYAFAKDAAGNVSSGLSASVNVTNDDGGGDGGGTGLEGPGSGLVGWWQFEETSGDVATDSSGRDHNGILINSPARVAGRVGNGALSFDGVSTYVDIPASPDFDFPGEFSISAWVYSTNPDVRVSAVSRSMGNLWHLWTLEQVGVERFDIEYVVREVYGTSSYRGIGSSLGFTANAWHHVVGVKTPGTSDVVKIYIDGNPGPDSLVITEPDPDLSGVNISIGSRRAMTPDSVWFGMIDDVRIYNRALSDAEVAALANPSETRYPLSVSLTGSGAGTVTSNPSGILCTGGSCTSLFDRGISVTLTAQAGTNAIFNGWIGGGCSGTGVCTVNLNSPLSITALFNTISDSDTMPPSIPTGLTATAVSSSQIDLAWTASTDNVGVTGTTIYRAGTPIAVVTSGQSYSDTNLSPSTAYSYSVQAFDAAGNMSGLSLTVGATTLAAGSAPSAATELRFEKFPNVFIPFKGETLTIRYQAPPATRLELKVVDRKGQDIKVLEAGPASAIWDGRNKSNIGVGSGTYILIMKANGVTLTKKIVVVK